MPLYKRTSSSSANSTGFLSLGCNPSLSKEGQFAFSNSPSNTGANQFSYLLCERYTEGSNFGDSPNPTGSLYVNLDNNYLTQGWFIKNNIIAVGESSDASQMEYFNSEISAFIFSEGNSSYNLIENNNLTLASTQPEFNACVFATDSGIRYEFYDSYNTKMKWTSKMEIIQNINTGKVSQVTLQSIQDQFSSGLFPLDSTFNSSSNNSTILDGGDDLDNQVYINVDAGIDEG